MQRLAERLAAADAEIRWEDRPSEAAVVWASLVKRNAPLMAHVAGDESDATAVAARFTGLVERRDAMVRAVEQAMGIEGQQYGSVTAALCYACNELVTSTTGLSDKEAVEVLVKLAATTRAEPPQVLGGDVSGQLTMTLNRVQALAPLVEEARIWSFGLPQEYVVAQTHARIMQLIEKAESRFVEAGSDSEAADRELLYRSFYSQVARIAIASYRRMAAADRDRLLAVTHEERRAIFERDYKGGRFGRTAMRNYLMEVGKHFGELLRSAVTARNAELRQAAEQRVSAA